MLAAAGVKLIWKSLLCDARSPGDDPACNADWRVSNNLCFYLLEQYHKNTSHMVDQYEVCFKCQVRVSDFELVR